MFNNNLDNKKIEVEQTIFEDDNDAHGDDEA